MPHQFDMAEAREHARKNFPHYVLGLQAGVACQELTECGYTRQRWIDSSDPLSVPSEEPKNASDLVVAQFPRPCASADRRPRTQTMMMMVTAAPSTVPDVEGMTVADARLACEDNRLDLYVSEGPTTASARVRSQTPTGGSEAAPGSGVYVITWIPR